ncbi:MAG: transposase [Betaproteobacteria bacterium]
MARPLRIEYAGALYHITSRGNARAAIYVDDADRRIFLRFLASAITRFKWRLYAYCLMGNHYHLLAETPLPNLSRGMRHLNGCYTQAFNRRHSRVGHVIQGRFDAKLVERENYLLELGRYIALNPVRAGLVDGADQWPWSSFRATAGLEEAPPWLASAPVLSMFSDDAGLAMKRYSEFVSLGIGRPSPWNALTGQVLLGSKDFVERMRPLLEQHAGERGVTKMQRFAARPSLGVLLPKAVPKAARNAGIVAACRSYGYTMAEVAAHLGLHYSSVFRIMQAENDEIEDLTPAFQGD